MLVASGSSSRSNIPTCDSNLEQQKWVSRTVSSCEEANANAATQIPGIQTQPELFQAKARYYSPGFDSDSSDDEEFGFREEDGYEDEEDYNEEEAQENSDEEFSDEQEIILVKALRDKQRAAQRRLLHLSDEEDEAVDDHCSDVNVDEDEDEDEDDEDGGVPLYGYDEVEVKLR
ncbi:hypothetical protein K3495_g11677 [Podosphaera aphanis]|nr:hypothetical protein K3495_g11677 [Podosphaera aphanis]